MDLDLNLVEISVPVKVELGGEIVRELTKADVKMLAVRSATPEDAPIKLVKRLSTRHHALARALAGGMQNWEAAAFTGYDETYVSILKSDPSFENLVQYYVNEQAKALVADAVLVNGVAHDALMLIQDKIESEPEKITVSQAIEIAKLGLDRSGVGPQTSHNHKHEHAISMADKMQAARKRIEAHRNAIVDITPTQADDAA